MFLAGLAVGIYIAGWAFLPMYLSALFKDKLDAWVVGLAFGFLWPIVLTIALFEKGSGPITRAKNSALFNKRKQHILHPIRYKKRIAMLARHSNIVALEKSEDMGSHCCSYEVLGEACPLNIQQRIT